jgi:putative hydrolase of the HAD superfamily
VAIQAITFDLDDTLWDTWPVIERAEARLHDWLKRRYPRIPEQFTCLDLRHLAGAVAEARPHMAHDRTALRKEALMLAATQAGYARFPVDAAFEVFFAARNQVVFFAEVLPVLERLTQRYVLGALSNGNADIRRVGLAHVFDFAFNAIDVGVAKPAPALFQAACRHLDLAPRQIVHVGDDPENDVRGAAWAGLHTVWINHTGREWLAGSRRMPRSAPWRNWRPFWNKAPNRRQPVILPARSTAFPTPGR